MASSRHKRLSYYEMSGRERPFAIVTKISGVDWGEKHDNLIIDGFATEILATLSAELASLASTC
jgi:hypothetical protein